jgi:hypothetical protein
MQNTVRGTFRGNSRRVRLNPQPPSGATYYDPWTLMCSPCQSGSVNYCQTVAPPATEDGEFDWILQSQRMPVPMSAPISECCTTETHPDTGAQITTCDVEQGCGWTAGQFLSDEMSCRFTTEGATYATHEECLSQNPGAPVGTAGTHVDWFPPCAPGESDGCYYQNVDACLPAVFGKHKSAARAGCPRYVCDGAQVIDSAGRVSFPRGACKCAQ